MALGAESAGVFAVYKNGDIFISENFGDLLEESNFLKYKKTVLAHLRKEKIKPDVIITDLHPFFKTTVLGAELAKKYKTKHIKVQHHIAHIFSAVGDRLLLQPTTYNLPRSFFGIAMDGTGYGLDGNIWGGEAFKFQTPNAKRQTIEFKRIGSLEEQIMIGGDLAVKEPARMLISVLNKFLPKEKVYKYAKKYYSRNQFEALYNQMEQNFNCQIATSTGRVLDAVSVLLGFAGNERNYKHEAVKKLEENSTKPYDDMELRIMNYESRKILNTTYLFEYLIKNIKRDKKRLAATAQKYIAEGFYNIIKTHDSRFMIRDSCFAAGGMANNKIISSFLQSEGVYLSRKIPRGDEGIAMGQIVYYLLSET